MTRWMSVLVVVAMGVACGTDPAATPDGGTDAGPGTDGGTDGGDDAGHVLKWPEPSLVIEGAVDPKLVQGPDGELTLVYLRDNKIWAWRDPGKGEPVELGAASTHSTDMSAVASPDEDRILVAWSGNSGVVLTDGVPDGPAFGLYQGDMSLNTVGASWVDGAPVVTAHTSYGGVSLPAGLLAFRVPFDAIGDFPLPAPAESQFLAKPVNSYRHYDETHRTLDLGDGRGLVFDTHHGANPIDPEYEKHWLVWRVVAPDEAATGPRRHYLVRKSTGFLEFPHWAAWVQPTRLPDGRVVLTYGTSENSLVYDVHLVLLDIAEDGTPSLGSTPLNISQTFGQTQNSDHALIHPTGDGRYWIVWRETDVGPLVAILDDKFQPKRIVGPSDALKCDESSSIGAVVDADGTLHLAAVSGTDDAFYLRLFSFPRP